MKFYKKDPIIDCGTKEDDWVYCKVITGFTYYMFTIQHFIIRGWKRDEEDLYIVKKGEDFLYILVIKKNDLYLI